MIPRVSGHRAKPLITDVEGLVCPCVLIHLSAPVFLAVFRDLGDNAKHNSIYHLKLWGQGWSFTVKEQKEP